jgi:hypothetical protein
LARCIGPCLGCSSGTTGGTARPENTTGPLKARYPNQIYMQILILHNPNSLPSQKKQPLPPPVPTPHTREHDSAHAEAPFSSRSLASLPPDASLQFALLQHASSTPSSCWPCRSGIQCLQSCGSDDEPVGAKRGGGGSPPGSCLSEHVEVAPGGTTRRLPLRLRHYSRDLTSSVGGAATWALGGHHTLD